MGGGDQDLLHEGIHPLEDGEVEELRALLVEVRHKLPALRHLFSRNFRGSSRKALRAETLGLVSGLLSADSGTFTTGDVFRFRWVRVGVVVR